MSINNVLTAGELPLQLAKKFKQARLNRNHSRAKAALLTGVPEGTLRGFETKGQISLRQFIMLCHGYAELSAFDGLFPEAQAHSIDQLLSNGHRPQRKRGRS